MPSAWGDSWGAPAGSCDYPAEGDVRSGVEYGSGAYTGSLLVPSLGGGANTLTHSPADVLRWLLVALGYGTDPDDGSAWPAFTGGEPGSPDAVITTYDTQGTDDGRSMIDGELFGNAGVQIRVRSATHAAGWVKADAIQTALAEAVYDETVHIGAATYLVHCVSGIGDVLALGKETPTSKRSLFTLNVTVSLKQL